MLPALGTRLARALGCALLVGCAASPRERSPQRSSAPSASSTQQRLRELRSIEAPLRAELSPREQAPWIDVSGADPYRLVPRPQGGFVGILRGAKALVTLDSRLGEVSRVRLPEAPSALCLSGGQAFVGSRWSRQIVRVQLATGQVSTFDSGEDAIADLACSDGSDAVHVLADGRASLSTRRGDGVLLDRRGSLAGGLRLVRRGQHLLELSLFERTLRVLELSPRGIPTRELTRIRHDGPLWGVDALPRDGELLVALSGAEDKPLVRSRGEFENIDSFVWLYRVGARGARPVFSLNVSEHGLLVPKALALARDGDSTELKVLASGSAKLLRARFAPSLLQPPELVVEPAMPGAADAVFDAEGVSFGSPLLDAWVRVDRSGIALARVDAGSRPPLEVRLGEALFTTELIAPASSSQGSHSRFTCETCHFEGGVDGRIHATGRASVSVVTKALFGLANNRPHFSRARDPDLSSVSHNEFRVAGAGSAEDPWFWLDTPSFPWLYELGVERARLSPLELRSALLRFLYAFTHAPNAAASGRARFSALEASGARVFHDRCASCHSARLESDRAFSEVPLAAWEELVLDRRAPLVWARGDYAQTGVLPYVHERGTRITSLRRLALKPRYFTKGSAATLTDVLTEFRTVEGGLHRAPEGTPGALTQRERQALLAFLRLL